MFQDSKGLLYISTFGGLSVYDGSRFTNYNTEDGLVSNTVNDIVELGNDSLWIIPNSHNLHCLVKGILKYVYTSDGFYPIVNKMIKCSDGSYLALADEGLFRFEKNHFSKINLVDNNGKDAGGFFVNAIEKNKKLFIITDPNVLPIAGPSRLIVYDLKNKMVTASKPSLAFFIIASPRGDILVATEKGIKKLDDSALLQNQIRFVLLPPIYKTAENLVANYLYFDRAENLWICTSRGLIKLAIDGQSKFFTTNNGLPANNLVSVFQDMENTMWFVNEQTGFSKLVNPQLEFYPQLKPGFSATDIYSNNSDSVWFLDGIHNKLLLQYNNIIKEFMFKREASRLPPRLIAFSRKGNYLVSPFKVNKCHFTQGKNVSLSTFRTDTTSNLNLAFSCALPDDHGNLILSSEDLTVMEQTNKTISYPLGYFSDGFVITSENRLWVVTREKKIFLFQVNPDDPAHYLQLLKMYNKELPEMSPRSIAVDKKGNVWIGSRDRGLFCLFFVADSFRSWKQITTKDGLSDDFISYLHPDEENNIWACSQGGLDKIQLKNGKFIIENVTRSNNIYQYISKIQTNKQGIHWVLTGSGIIRIAPSEKIESKFQPKIIFREIFTGGTKINVWSDVLSLDYQQSNLSFSMATPSFIDEKQIRFSYLLEGSGNKSWSDPLPQPVISLANLAPGKYTLKAKSQFINGRYPDTETSFSFVIHPPWWQTWWFRSGLVCLSLIILGLILRSYYQRKLQRQQIILEKQQAVEKERTRIAADMHDDLGAGLSTIRFLSEKAKQYAISQAHQDEIERMQFTSNELIDKMNEIIWSMSEKNNSLEDLLLFIRSYCMEYSEENNLDCSIEISENIPALFASGETRRNIFLTVKETLHNIVKHAAAKRIIIIIESSKKLEITIKDDGRGFKANQQTSTGNGLRNMQKRIESIGGSICFENENGTIVRISIPLA